MDSFYDATIDCNEQTRETYKWARGEFETNPDGSRRLDENKRTIPKNPISFPLEHCTVTHFGGRCSISLPRPAARGQEQQADLRLDVLSDSPDVKEQQLGEKTIFTISGVSERKHNMGIMDEHAIVEFKIIRHAGYHAPGQALQLS